MKSRLLIALLSLGLGLNTALLVVTVRKLERVERQVTVEPPAPVVEVVETDPEEDPSEDEHRGPPMLFGLPRVDPEALDLTDEQNEQIRRLRAEWKAEEGERFRASIERRREIPELFESEDVSMEKLTPLLDQAHEDAKSRLAAVLRLFHQYQEILTPEQQERFKELIREQQKEHRSHWERYRERDSRRGRRDGDSDGRSRGRGRDDDRRGSDDSSRRERFREEWMKNESGFGGMSEIDPEMAERFREERQRRRQEGESAGPQMEEGVPPLTSGDTASSPPGDPPPSDPEVETGVPVAGSIPEVSPGGVPAEVSLDGNPD